MEGLLSVNSALAAPTRSIKGEESGEGRTDQIRGKQGNSLGFKFNVVLSILFFLIFSILSNSPASHSKTSSMKAI